MTKYIRITGKDLLKKIQEGERDFARVKLTESIDFSVLSDYPAVISYLQKRTRKEAQKNPFCFKHAKIRSAQMQELWMPYSDFSYSNLSSTNFSHSNFKGVHFAYAMLENTSFFSGNLAGADFFRADLYHADLRGADLRKTNFSGTDLSKVDFRETKNLEHAAHVGYAIFDRTIVTSQERKILQKILDAKTYFEVIL